jgi:hypothetical protein
MTPLLVFAGVELPPHPASKPVTAIIGSSPSRRSEAYATDDRLKTMVERIMPDDPGIKAGVFTDGLHAVRDFPTSSLP